MNMGAPPPEPPKDGIDRSASEVSSWPCMKYENHPPVNPVFYVPAFSRVRLAILPGLQGQRTRNADPEFGL